MQTLRQALVALGDVRTLGAAALVLLCSAFVPMPLGVREVLLVVAAGAATLMPAAAARRSGRPLDLVELGVAVGIAYFVLFPLRAAVVLNDFDGAANARVLEVDPVIEQKVLIFVTLGFVAGAVAYLLPIGARLGRRVHVPRVSAVETPSLGPAVGLFALGVVAHGTAIAMYRWPDPFSVVAGRASGLVSGATAFALVGLCLLAQRTIINRNRANFAIVICAVCIAVLVGLLGQFKEIAILALATPLLMWHFSRRQGLPLRWFAAALIFVVFLIFPLVTIARWTSLRIDTLNPTRVAPAFVDQTLHYDWVTGAPRSQGPQDFLTQPLAVTSHRLYGYDAMTLAVRYTPEQIPYKNGGTLQNLLSGFVPRIIWAEKPRIGIGYWFSVNYWGTPSGVPVVPQTVTHPGELYIDFGVGGVITGLAILGIWYRFAWEGLRPRESATAALLYTILFLTVIDVDRDLPLVYVTLVQRLAVTTILLLALAAASRLRRAELASS